MIIEKDDYVYIAAIILQAALLVYFVRRAVLAYRSKKNKKTNTPATSDNSYEHTRNITLQVTQEQLGLTSSPSTHKVYGVVMDWDMGSAVLTLSSFITGAASVAMSSGGVVTGVGKNPDVAELAAQFVQLAQDFLSRALPVSVTSLPPRGTVRFYFLTNQGIYAAQEQLSSINDNSSPFLPLFFRGNMVIEEIKKSV